MGFALLLLVFIILFAKREPYGTASRTRGTTYGNPIDMQAQFVHSDSRTTLEIHTRTIGPELFAIVSQSAGSLLETGS